MGVYIKGMDKPKSCHDCPFNYDWQECLVKNSKEYDSWDFTNHSVEYVYSTCPLQPVDDMKVEKTQRELNNAWQIFKSVLKDEKL